MTMTRHLNYILVGAIFAFIGAIVVGVL